LTNLTLPSPPQKETGYIGTAIISLSVLLNILTSKLSDLFFGHLKTVICWCLGVSAGLSVWLALLALSVLPPSKTGLYVSAVGSMVALRSTLALFYELQMELNYPAPESLVSLLWSQVYVRRAGISADVA
jgi:hypothetical protein